MLIFILSWIIFSIYHNSATSTISQSLNQNIIPITPDFDSKTIDEIKERENVSPIFELIPQESSPSGEISDEEEASP